MAALAEAVTAATVTAAVLTAKAVTAEVVTAEGVTAEAVTAVAAMDDPLVAAGTAAELAAAARSAGLGSRTSALRRVGTWGCLARLRQLPAHQVHAGVHRQRRHLLLRRRQQPSYRRRPAPESVLLESMEGLQLLCFEEGSLELG